MPKSDVKYVIDDDVSGAVLSSGAGTVASTFDETQADVWLSKKTTDDVTEGATNLYYSDARVSANSDVAANTAKRHDAATAGTLITLTGQQVGVDLTGSPTWTGLHQFNSRVGIGAAADSQFMLDVNGAIRGTYLIGKHAIQLSDATLLCHYDGGTETNFYADTATHLGQPPTKESGSVVGVADGKFNGAVSLTEGFTNLFANPIVEDLSGFSVYGSSTLALGSNPRHGQNSLEVTPSTGTYDGMYFTAAMTSGVTYTASVMISSVSGNVYQIVLREDSAAGTIIGTATVTATGDYVLLSASGTASVTGTLYCLVRKNNSANTDVFDVDDVQVTATSYRLPFRYYGMPSVSGSLGSPSVVTASRLEYSSDVLSADAGTIAAWIKPYFVDTTYRNYVWHDSNPSYFFIRSNIDASSFLVRAGDTAVTRGTVDVDNWQHVALTWSNGTAAFYVNGVLSGSTWSYSNAAVGSNPLAIFARDTGAEHASGEIDDLVILNRATSADEIRAIYESNAPVFAETSVRTFQTGNSGNRVWLNENGLFAEDDAGLPSFALANADGITWNGETLNTRDVLLGDNSTGAANIYFDASAGTFSIRGGTTEQVKIAADGSLQAGATTLDTTGIDIALPLSTFDTNIGYKFTLPSGTGVGGSYGVFGYGASLGSIIDIAAGMNYSTGVLNGSRLRIYDSSPGATVIDAIEMTPAFGSVYIDGTIKADYVMLPQVTAPSGVSSTGRGSLFIDNADGDLKILFSNGTVKTIATN